MSLWNSQIIEQRVQSRTSHQHVCIKWSHNQKLHYWELRYGQIQKFSNPNNWKQNKHLLPTSCLDEGTLLHLHDIYRQQVISYSYSKIINQHLPSSFPQLVRENQMKMSTVVWVHLHQHWPTARPQLNIDITLMGWNMIHYIKRICEMLAISAV